jgi:hypothetical protein
LRLEWRLRFQRGLRLGFRVRVSFLRRRRGDAEARGCAADDLVLDGCIDQRDLRERDWAWLVGDREPPLGFFEFQAVLFFAPCEFGREPLRTDPSG